MKCDSCRRERTDEQLKTPGTSGIRFCGDREDCHRYRTEGRYNEAAQELIESIISGLLHATCAENEAHGCVIVWSSGAQEQIAAHLVKKLQWNTTGKTK
jgi:NMD protein affecting ribosome stability and mRNA decay